MNKLGATISVYNSTYKMMDCVRIVRDCPEEQHLAAATAFRNRNGNLVFVDIKPYESSEFLHDRISSFLDEH